MHKVRLQGYDNNMNNTTVKTAKYKRGRMCSSLLGYLFFIHFKCCLNKSLLFSGHFTKDCFSAPGLQYALLPDEDDEEPRQQQTPSAAPQQDSDKKKKKKKVNMWRLMSQAVLTSFVCVCVALLHLFFFCLLTVSHLMQQPTHIQTEWQYMCGCFTPKDTRGLCESCQKSH